MAIRFPKPQILDSVSSTNDYLKAFVEAAEPRVVLAREQTRGKGSQGRNWVSERGLGLYVSYLFFPAIPADQSARLNRVAALSVALTLEELCSGSAAVRIKPPNDILLNLHKISGILLETASLGNRLSWAVLGIGINLSQRTFSFQASPAPTSLALEGIPVPSRDALCDILTKNLTQLLAAAEGGLWSPVENEFEHRVWSPDIELSK